MKTLQRKTQAGKVMVEEIIAIAVRADLARQDGLALALYELAGRMDRDRTGSFDADEAGEVALALGVRRCLRGERAKVDSRRGMFG